MKNGRWSNVKKFRKIREAVKNQKVVFVLAISFVTVPHVEP